MILHCFILQIIYTTVFRVKRLNHYKLKTTNAYITHYAINCLAVYLGNRGINISYVKVQKLVLYKERSNDHAWQQEFGLVSVLEIRNGLLDMFGNTNFVRYIRNGLMIM